LGGDPSLAPLLRDIAERAQGNPFFCEELVQSLVERGVFEGRPGAYRLKQGIELPSLPTTVQAVLSARIDRLPEQQRHVLQRAAVIGREVSLAVLQRVVELPAAEILKVLSLLQKSELFYQTQTSGVGSYAFRHPLVQEVAYQTILKGRRREIHRQIAHAVEAQFVDQPGEHAGLVGFHLEQAGDLLLAAQAHARASLWLGAKDRKQALKSWKKARELLTEVPASSEVDNLRMMACGQIVNFGWNTGLPANEARVYFDEAKALAVASGNVRANAMLHAGFGRALAVQGSADDYVDKAKEAVRLATLAGDASLEIMLKASLCHALRLSGRLKAAVEINLEVTRRASDVNRFHRQLLGFDIEPWLSALMGQLLIMLGRGEEARPFLDRVILMNAEHINMSDHMMPSISYVDLAWATSDAEMARQHSNRAIAMAEQSGSPYFQTYARACNGLYCIISERPVPAINELTAAIEFARKQEAGLEYESKMLADLANAYRLNGNLAAAASTAIEAISVSERRHTRIASLFAHIVLGHTLLASGQRDSASSMVEKSVRLLEETGALLYGFFLDELKVKLVGSHHRSN
jgi:adenylate cyclase